jgi:hypothetical protein
MATTATPTKISNIEIKKYSDKSYVLTGDTYHLKNVITENRLGVYNKNLTDPITKEKISGWIFANNKLDTFKELVANNCSAEMDYKTKIKKEYGKAIESIGTCLDAKKQAKTSLKSELKTYLIEHINELKETLGIVLNQKSIVKNDIDKKDKKVYIMIGECGFSYIRFDARNKKATEISEAAMELKDSIDKIIIKTFTSKELNYLENIGCPIEAILFQNMTYKSKYNEMVKDFMTEKYNIKKVSIENMVD